MKINTIDADPSADIFSPDFLVGNVGAPFIMGLAVGYFAKKMLLIALFLRGAAIVLLFVGEYYGITEISDINLQQAAKTATDAAKQSGDFLIKRLSSITSKGVSAAGGFFVGFKLG
ncbi:MAG: FUN14 domain-containing protein [Methylococcales bacterium]|nr:FUN14 domain-containing protein [Methylococcales bacterium]